MVRELYIEWLIKLVSIIKVLSFLYPSVSRFLKKEAPYLAHLNWADCWMNLFPIRGVFEGFLMKLSRPNNT